MRTEKAFDRAGSLKYVNRYLDAVRTDGSSVKQVVTSIENRRTINLTSGDEIRVNDLIGKKSTYPKKFSQVPSRNPGSSCRAANDQNWIIEGADSIEGHRTTRHVLAEGTRKMTAWYALDAQCALLQLRFEHEDGVTTQSLTSLALGEPSSSLFEVASTYQEVPPSSLFVRICKDGETCSSLPATVTQRLDKNYYALRASSH